METNPNPDLDLIHVAIQRFLHDKKKMQEVEQQVQRKRQPHASVGSVFFEHQDEDEVEVEVDDDDDDFRLLSQLLSQVESLKAGRRIEKPGASGDIGAAVHGVKVKSDATIEAVEIGAEDENGGGEAEATPEEIVRELKNVKKQNTVTHWLLSAMIVLTLAWQLSEVSLIFKVRDGLRHPFRSFGSAITGLFKGPATNGRDDGDEDKHPDQRQSETMGIPPLKMPELPHFDAPNIIPNGENHSTGSG